MKAEHRHELKTNELAQWIADFPQWAKENLKTIIYVSVVVVVVAGAYVWRKYQTNVVAVQKQLQLTGLISGLSQNRMQILRAGAEGIDYSYTLIQVANNLGNFAQQTKDEYMSAFALIKKAQALRTELHYRIGTPDKQNAIDQINRAKAAYDEALTRTGGNSSLKALAAFGLGLCEEELGNFDQAKEIYKRVAEDSSFEATTAAASAKRRLEVMDDYKLSVVFKEPEKPLPDVIPPLQIEFDRFDINPTGQIPGVTTPNLPTSQ